MSRTLKDRPAKVRERDQLDDFRPNKRKEQRFSQPKKFDPKRVIDTYQSGGLQEVDDDYDDYR